MPARKGSKNAGDGANPQDQKIFKFVKDEIVFAKMKFFSAWPAKVSLSFQSGARFGDFYKFLHRV